MTTNVLKVTDLIAKESLRIAHEQLGFIATVDRSLDEEFKMNGRGSPHGATLRVKDPNQYITRSGNAMEVQDQAESTQTVTLATLKGVDMGFSMQELIQSVDNDGAFDDLSKNYIQPAIAQLVSTIESEVISFCTLATANLVASAQTSPAAITTLLIPGLARAKLNQNAAPKGNGNRFIQVDSLAMAGMVNGVSTLFHDGAQLKEQYREGMMGRTAMADWYENDRMHTTTNLGDVAGAVDVGAGVLEGATTSVVDGLTTAFTVGATITFASVKAVHPETKATMGHLAQFVVVSSTTTALTFAPAMYASGPKQNVSALAANDAIITAFGNASAGYVNNLMYHKEAYQFITAPLPIVDDAHKCVRVSKDGLSLRAWMGSDIRNNELLMRIDILYGIAALRPQWACKMIGAAV